MKVSRLIKLLKKCDPKANVWLRDTRRYYGHGPGLISLEEDSVGGLFQTGDGDVFLSAEEADLDSRVE